MLAGLKLHINEIFFKPLNKCYMVIYMPKKYLPLISQTFGINLYKF